MVNVVAYQQVDLTDLLIKGHLADTGSAVLSQRSSSGFKVHQGDNSIKADFFFKGHDIKYVGGYPWQGSITSLLIKINGDTAYTFSGTKMSVQEAWKIYNMDDPMQVGARVLKGNDNIKGSAFDDMLWGFNGNDTIFGRGGSDKLVGGNGRDVMDGGAMNDTFVFRTLAESVVGAKRDTINNFNNTQTDRIDLSIIDADRLTDGNQAFTFIGSDAFSDHAGDLTGLVRVVPQGAGWLVQVDVRGTAKAVDMEIKVFGTMPGEADFFL